MMLKPEPKIEARIFKTSSTWRTARLAIFTALSVVGSFIKIPSPIGSLAFDSAPGFFVALFFGPFEGGLVCGLGHMATAAVSGFPLGLLHLPIALGMALAGVAIALLNRLNRKWALLPALVMGIVINTVLVFPLVPWLSADINIGWIIATSYAPFLFVAATLNAIASGMVYVAVRGKL